MSARVDLRRLPRHLAIVMDGNGRWAERHGLPRPEGHRAGSEAVRRTVRAARRLGLGTLTLYAFSEQNWARPADEVEALMGLFAEFLVSERQEMLDNGIRLRAIGRIRRLPGHVRALLDDLVRESAGLGGMTLNLCVSYGGQEEIADAARRLCERVARGELSAEQVDEAALEREIPSVATGPVDLLVRTGGEQRISNFVLWGAAYAELFFSPTLWPDYAEQDLFEAIAAYQRRERRFGKTSAQLAAEQRARAVAERS